MTHLWFLWLPLAVFVLAGVVSLVLPGRWLYENPGSLYPCYRDWVAVVGWLVLVPTLIWLAGDALTGAVYGMQSRSCANAAHHLHVGHDYDLWAGCFVIVNGHEIPLRAYRATEQVNR